MRPRPQPRKRWVRARFAMLDARALYRLMTWLSPAYPIGAFSYSSGIEWAVEAGDIHDATSLQSCLTVMIAEGGGYCDAVFFAHAYRAAADGDDAVLRAYGRACDGLCALAGTAFGDNGAGPRLPRHNARGVAARARSTGSRRSPMAPSRFPSRSRSRARATALRFPSPSLLCARARGKSHLGRNTPPFRSASPTASASSPRSSRW